MLGFFTPQKSATGNPAEAQDSGAEGSISAEFVYYDELYARPKYGRTYIAPGRNDDEYIDYSYCKKEISEFTTELNEKKKEFNKSFLKIPQILHNQPLKI